MRPPRTELGVGANGKEANSAPIGSVRILHIAKAERFPLRRVAIVPSPIKIDGSIKMTLVERSTIPSSSSYGSSGRTQAADVPKDDLAAQGAAKTNIESVISDVSEKGQEALNYAGQKGQEAMDSVHKVGDTIATAVEKSVQARPYTTALALALAAGFLVGAAWRR
jgi:ElaB/YqjD/DUF883 family membrane-anchored ribosome-binding protein